MLGACSCEDVAACEADCEASQCSNAAKQQCEACHANCDSDTELRNTAVQMLQYETCVAKCDNRAACGGDALDFSSRCDGM
eukprot:COSAG02_NODE_2394_length_8958_cov_174.117478_6_plen_81_part_00